MIDYPDAQGIDEAPIPPEIREALLATLAGREHLLFESIGQTTTMRCVPCQRQ